MNSLGNTQIEATPRSFETIRASLVNFSNREMDRLRLYDTEQKERGEKRARELYLSLMGISVNSIKGNSKKGGIARRAQYQMFTMALPTHAQVPLPSSPLDQASSRNHARFFFS